MRAEPIGSVLAARLVKARWAWSELRSPRFGKLYENLGANAVRLRDLAMGGMCFTSLNSIDLDILVSLIERRQPGFMPAFSDVRSFACVGWTKHVLLELWTIPRDEPQQRSAYQI